MQFFSKTPAGQVAAVMRRVYERGLTTATGGNISMLVENGDIWITPKGFDKGSLTEDDIVCVHPDGTYDGKHEPSSEIAFHRATYRARPDFRAVVHAHPVHCIAFSLTRTLPRIDLVLDTMIRCRNMRLSKYAMMGSVALGENLFAEFSKGADVVFLENHGVCVGGENLLEAYQRFESIEYAAKLDLLSRKLGEAVGINEEQIGNYEKRIPAEVQLLHDHKPNETEQVLRAEMTAKLRRGCEHGLLSGAVGVCSARISESSFLITPEGLDLALLEECDLVYIDEQGKEAGKTPSKETALHTKIYRQHANVNAIFSAVPPNIAAFASSKKIFETSTIPESYYMLRAVPEYPFEEPFQNPAKTAALFSNKTPAVLFRNYGIVTTGDSLFTAFDRLEVAEATAASIITAQDAGTVVYLSKNEIRDLVDTFHLE